MATSVVLLTRIFQKCLGPNPPETVRYLDIGAQNLQGGSAEDYRAFVAYCLGPHSLTPEHERACIDLAERSASKDPPWCSELFALVGWEYQSVDWYIGTISADLNVFQLNEQQAGYFDIVGNFGTTEHVLNQHLVLRTIHFAARPGGFIIHFVPVSGFFYHCLFSYNPKLFLLLARENAYRLVHAGLHRQGTSVVDHRHATWFGYDSNLGVEFPDLLGEFIFQKLESNDFRGCYDWYGNDYEINWTFDEPCSSVRRNAATSPGTAVAEQAKIAAAPKRAPAQARQSSDRWRMARQTLARFLLPSLRQKTSHPNSHA